MTDNNSIIKYRSLSDFKGHDLTGQQFGRLTVLGLADTEDRRRTRWYCQCICGQIKMVQAETLQNQSCKSCGCLRKEITVARATKHGQSCSVLYRTWARIKDRCRCPTCKSFPDYGRRGIKVCFGWLNSFESFAHDMGPRPEDGEYSIERKDNEGHYSCGHCKECVQQGWPTNCRWANKKDQCNNRRTSHWVIMHGRRQTLAQWCEEIGINPRTVQSRIRRGSADIKALTMPLRRQTILQ